MICVRYASLTLFVAIASLLVIDLSHNAYSSVSNSDIEVLEAGAKNTRDISDFATTCYLESNNNPSDIQDCTSVMKSFNLKMDELNDKYGELIKSIISEK